MARTYEPRNWTGRVAKKRKDECFFGKNVDRACVAIPRVNPNEEDTKLRLKIQEEIRGLLKKRLSAEQILRELECVKEFEKYKQHFEKWISHGMKKMDNRER